MERRATRRRQPPARYDPSLEWDAVGEQESWSGGDARGAGRGGRGRRRGLGVAATATAVTDDAVSTTEEEEEEDDQLPEAPLPVLQAQVAALLERITRRDHYFFFSEPVDAAEVPDYYRVVAEPMDLGTMRKRNEAGEYRDLEAVARDLERIWHNCLEYNAEGSVYVREARRLRKFAEQQLEWCRRALEREGYRASAVVEEDGRTVWPEASSSATAAAGEAAAARVSPIRLAALEAARAAARWDAAGAPVGGRATPAAEAVDEAAADDHATEAERAEMRYAVAADDPPAFIERMWRAFLVRRDRRQLPRSIGPEEEAEGKSGGEMAEAARACLSRWLGVPVARPSTTAAERRFTEALQDAGVPQPQVFLQRARDRMTTLPGAECASHQPPTIPPAHWALRQLPEALLSLRRACIVQAPAAEQARAYDTLLALLKKAVEDTPPRQLVANSTAALHQYAEHLLQQHESRKRHD
ncbi:hypothetical protein CDCA_CDCA20G4775 [Cyanidium caldarium]|uniref:Bromo domain-containing protein n=1 Tax=Cyanidium caldarium TaxID=2771 RepID=A0AAV9J2Z8_CYACA|nr:hypothetical protein CDCA_CDCA20G4775 [Cyanidium caldarium]